MIIFARQRVKPRAALYKNFSERAIYHSPTCTRGENIRDEISL
jgi:hypothetical protein